MSSDYDGMLKKVRLYKVSLFYKSPLFDIAIGCFNLSTLWESVINFII